MGPVPTNFKGLGKLDAKRMVPKKVFTRPGLLANAIAKDNRVIRQELTDASSLSGDRSFADYSGSDRC